MPPSAREWLSSQEEDTGALKERYQEWIAMKGNLERMAPQRLYENDNATEKDLRLHLLALTSLICAGEGIALEAEELRDNGGVPGGFFEKEISEIDDSIAAFVSLINKWHGTIDSQEDIPASLKKSFAEAKAGEVIPFPDTK